MTAQTHTNSPHPSDLLMATLSAEPRRQLICRDIFLWRLCPGWNYRSFKSFYLFIFSFYSNLGSYRIPCLHPSVGDMQWTDIMRYYPVKYGGLWQRQPTGTYSFSIFRCQVRALIVFSRTRDRQGCSIIHSPLSFIRSATSFSLSSPLHRHTDYAHSLYPPPRCRIHVLSFEHERQGRKTTTRTTDRCMCLGAHLRFPEFSPPMCARMHI